MRDEPILEGTLIARQVRRTVDTRLEARSDLKGRAGLMTVAARARPVRIGNISPSGAMVYFGGVPHIGEAVSLQLREREQRFGHICWVRQGRVGIEFRGSSVDRRGDVPNDDQGENRRGP